MSPIDVLGNDDVSQYGTREIDGENESRRLPVFILVDVSQSMKQAAPNVESMLKGAVEDLYDVILAHPEASRMTELGVMVFSSEIKVVEKLREIKSHKGKGRNLEFSCQGQTLTGLAVQRAIKLFDERLKDYRRRQPRIYHYAPLLFILSDGQSYCSVPDVKEANEAALQWCIDEIRDRVKKNRMAVVAVEVGDYCDHDQMRQLTGCKDDRHVKKIGNHRELSQFFKLTSSIITTSSKNANVNVNQMDLGSIDMGALSGGDFDVNKHLIEEEP